MGEDVKACVSDDYERAYAASIPFGGFKSCEMGNPLAATLVNNAASSEDSNWPQVCTGLTVHGWAIHSTKERSTVFRYYLARFSCTLLSIIMGFAVHRHINIMTTILYFAKVMALLLWNILSDLGDCAWMYLYSNIVIWTWEITSEGVRLASTWSSAWCTNFCSSEGNQLYKFDTFHQFEKLMYNCCWENHRYCYLHLHGNRSSWLLGQCILALCLVCSTWLLLHTHYQPLPEPPAESALAMCWEWWNSEVVRQIDQEQQVNHQSLHYIWQTAWGSSGKCLHGIASKYFGFKWVHVWVMEQRRLLV